MNSFLRVCLGLMLPAILIVSAEAGGAKAGISDLVMAVGTDSIRIQTASVAGYKVTNIDSDGKITDKGPSNIATYKVDSFTSIVVDGLKSKLTDVKVGMKVDVEIGMDPKVLGSISAHTVPPAPKPVPKGVPPPPPVIGMDRVLAISDDRITVGSSSTKYPVAYFITRDTVVNLDGVPSTVKAIHVGMSAHIVASDQTTAAVINIHNVIE